MGTAIKVHIRVGLVAGSIGLLLGYLAQLGAGLGALALVGLAALLAGLGTAKWLPRDWYGHQLKAGAQSGIAACALTIFGILLSLIVSGQHDTRLLAAQSHLLGLNLSSAVHALAAIGWLGAGLLLSIAGGAIGIPLAALIALVAAWDKNRRAIQVVERAREAAQRSNRLATGDRPTRDPSAPPVTGAKRGQSDAGSAPNPRAAPAGPRHHPPVRFPRPQPQPQPQPQPTNPALHTAFAAWGDADASPPPAPPPAARPPAQPIRQPQPQPRRAPDPDPDEENWLC